MALSGWKALLKIGGCLLCWKELQVPKAGLAPYCHLAGLGQSSTSATALVEKGLSVV